MTDTEALPDTPPTRSGKGRSIAATIVYIIAVALLPIAIIAFWAQRTVTDTQQYAETVQPLAYNEQVQDSVAIFVTEKIEEQIDTEALVQQIFGGLIEQAPALKALVPVVSGAIDSLIAQVVDRLVRSDAFAALWGSATTAAQQGLLAILEGRDSGAISLQGDNVVLDISSVIDAVKQGLVEQGFEAAANIDIPVAEQQVVLFQSPELAQLRTLYSFTKPLMTWLVFAVVALFVLAVVIARRRPRMVAWVGGAILVVGGVLIIALDIGKGVFVNSLDGTPFEQASTVFYDTLLQFLYAAAAVTLLLGIILLVVGLYLCQARWAVALRGSVNGLAGKIGGTIPEGPVTRSGAWIAQNARWLRVAVAVLFAVIVVWGGQLSVDRTLIAALIALILLAIIQVWDASATVTRAPREDAVAA